MENEMNINVEGFTRERLITALFSSARKVRYEFSVSNSAGEHLGMIEVQNASITYDSTSGIMRTFTGSVKECEFMNLGCIDYRITPWMVLDIDGKEAKWALGVFMITPKKTMSAGINMIGLQGYDLTKIANEDKLTTREIIKTNTLYTSFVGQLLGTDYSNIDIEESTLAKAYDQEWEIGTSKLDMTNMLLEAINYNPLHFNELGVGIVNPYTAPEDREIDFQYISNKTSVIVDGLSVSSDKYNIPNKWVRYTENVDAPYYISTYVNDDPNNKYSTVSRGRTIVDSKVVEDIASQQELDAYIRKVAAESMQAVDKLEFSTLNMPGHSYKECLWVEIKEYGIMGKYIEKAWQMELKPGGLMKHVCERAVEL